MGDKKSQLEKVLKHLRTHKKGITSMTAFLRYRITRLSGHIFVLRQKGFEIITINEPNTFTQGHHGRYVLVGEPDYDTIQKGWVYFKISGEYEILV